MIMMVINYKIKYQGRSFSILAGVFIGIFLLLLSNLIGESTIFFISLLHNFPQFSHSNTIQTIPSIFGYILAILFSGIFTTLLMDEKKRNCIFSGITGILILILSICYFYIAGDITLLYTSQIVTILGPAGMLLDFIIYTIPLSMIGFIFGFFGGYLAEYLLERGVI
jgi:hypothetical protein